MATPASLKFLNDIQGRNVQQVQLSLRKGYADPNQNYLNVFPLNLAIEQACWAPAPPNTDSAWLFGLKPLACVTDLIGLAIASLDTLRKPIAASGTVNFLAWSP